jgi:isopenicillin N synthase-like dioxygenase
MGSVEILTPSGISKIPVIDYAPFLSGDEGALDRVADKVAQACEQIGFFYVLNHSVPDEVIETTFTAARRFFAMPLTRKMALRLDQDNLGYLPIGASVQGVSTVRNAIRPNRNESFFVSYDRPVGHPDVTIGKPTWGRNQWPADLPELRADLMAYFGALSGLCQRMLPSFALAIGVPADVFASYFAGEPYAKLRFLHYPPRDTTEEGAFGQRPHTDNSFVTVLARTSVPGLSVRLPSGEWIAPPTIPGTFLITLGNIMRRWSNDRFLSAPHRVLLNPEGVDRYSIAFFFGPQPDSVIECLPSCVSTDNPAHYRPAVFRDLILDFHRATYFCQRNDDSEFSLQETA